MSPQSRHAARTQEWPALAAGRAPLSPGMAPAAERQAVRPLVGFRLIIVSCILLAGVVSCASPGGAAGDRSGYFIPISPDVIEEVRWLALWKSGDASLEYAAVLRVSGDREGDFADCICDEAVVSDRSVRLVVKSCAGAGYQFSGEFRASGTFAELELGESVVLAGVFERQAADGSKLGVRESMQFRYFAGD